MAKQRAKRCTFYIAIGEYIKLQLILNNGMNTFTWIVCFVFFFFHFASKVLDLLGRLSTNCYRFLTFRLNFSALKRKWKTRYIWIFYAFRSPNSTFYSCIVCDSCNLHILSVDFLVFLILLLSHFVSFLLVGSLFFFYFIFIRDSTALALAS